MNIKEIFSVTLILFAVIDILGSIPIIIDLRKKTGKVEAEKATFVAGVLMIAFLYLGESVLGLFGVDVQSFAMAGAFIMFLLGIEMVLGLTIFKGDSNTSGSSSIVPLAFPIIAGAGTMTTLISIRSEYQMINVLIGILVNLVFIYFVLKISGWIGKKIGHAGANILRKVFGIILLAIAIKIFKSQLG